MDGQQPGFRALKVWEKDGKWGVAAAESLVPAYDMTREEAIQALDSYYKLGGKSAQEHTDDFHKFNENQRDVDAEHKRKADEHEAQRGPGSKIPTEPNANDADTSEQERAAKQQEAANQQRPTLEPRTN